MTDQDRDKPALKTVLEQRWREVDDHYREARDRVAASPNGGEAFVSRIEAIGRP
jgi:hypothetical protein